MLLRCFVYFVALILLWSCRHEPRESVNAGSFRVERILGSYDAGYGGRTTYYYNYRVYYRGRDISYLARGLDAMSKRDVFDHAYIVPANPVAVLALTGDADATWTLFVDSADGLKIDRIARHRSSINYFAWLDSDRPQPIVDLRGRFSVTGGRWLWIENQALLDTHSLAVRRLKASSDYDSGAEFVAFSPDRKHMARYVSESQPYCDEPGRPYNPKYDDFILDNDVETGEVVAHQIDRNSMWFETSTDLNAQWLDAYFEWLQVGTSYTLQRRAIPKPRPYQGSISDDGDGTLTFSVPRFQFSHRRAVMEMLATALSAKVSFDKPRQVTNKDNPSGLEKLAEEIASADMSAAAAAAETPPAGNQISAELSRAAQHVRVFFGAGGGLSVSSDTPQKNELIRQIADVVNTQLRTPAGQRWIEAIDDPSTQGTAVGDTSCNVSDT